MSAYRIWTANISPFVILDVFVIGTLDHATTCTIATSLIQSKLDNYNSLFLNLNCQQSKPTDYNLFSALLLVPSLKHLNTIISLLISSLESQNHTTHAIQNSLTYKSLQFKQPSSILDLLEIQPTHSTCSSAVVTLQRPSNPSRLKITDRSFC